VLLACFASYVYARADANYACSECLRHDCPLQLSDDGHHLMHPLELVDVRKVQSGRAKLLMLLNVLEEWLQDVFRR